ncbi:unnamed protein product [Cylicocyclus nassatus]|uniref:SCP domain-containing protein n=1 Tax=Cylicocyclus nassatus TaxID=53992 RepID=A0AA36GYR8_CYLNA|nr:unnamed protein product [Cylicocyclus nassatus]
MLLQYLLLGTFLLSTALEISGIHSAKPLSNGDTVHENGDSGCESCATGINSDAANKPCAKDAASGAVYPTGTSTRCLKAGMTDELRMNYLDMHNFRRHQLANGHVAKNNGNLLPKATNMIKLELDCDLEADAIAYAGTCPNEVSDESTRSGIGEHYHRIAVSKAGPAYVDGLKSAVTSWWKVVRQYPGIGMAAMFRANHVGTPIETFTQMGWAKTSKLGCSIVTCSSDYVVICRYSPKGNVVDENVYIPGTPCSQCIGTCYSDLGLCSA